MIPGTLIPKKEQEAAAARVAERRAHRLLENAPAPDPDSPDFDTWALAGRRQGRGTPLYRHNCAGCTFVRTTRVGVGIVDWYHCEQSAGTEILGRKSDKWDDTWMGYADQIYMSVGTDDPLLNVAREIVREIRGEIE